MRKLIATFVLMMITAIPLLPLAANGARHLKEVIELVSKTPRAQAGGAVEV